MDIKLALPQYINKADLIQSLEKATNSETLEITDIKIAQPDFKGGHFMSSIDTMRITTRNLKTNEEKLFHVFAKFNTPDENRKKIMSVVGDPAYKEVVFFNDVLQTLKEFCKSELIGTDQEITLDHFPFCYYTAVSDYNPVILEDLAVVGYDVNTPSEDQGRDHILLVLTYMAEYHAVSAHYLRKHKEELLKKHPFLEFNLFNPQMQQVFGQFLYDTYTTSIAVLDCPDHREKFELFQSLAGKLYKSFETINQPLDPFSVISMGDCWCNNIMFKRNSEGKPTNVKFIDLQAIRIDCMTFDLAYYIFTSTDHTKWKTDLLLYLRYYYNQFDSTIRRFPNVDSCGFTFEEFHELFKLRCPVAIHMMLSIIPVRFITSHKFTDPGKKEENSNIIDEFTSAVRKMTSEDGLKDILKERLISTYWEMEYGLKVLNAIE